MVCLQVRVLNSESSTHLGLFQIMGPYRPVPQYDLGLCQIVSPLQPGSSKHAGCLQIMGPCSQHSVLNTFGYLPDHGPFTDLGLQHTSCFSRSWVLHRSGSSRWPLPEHVPSTALGLQSCSHLSAQGHSAHVGLWRSSLLHLTWRSSWAADQACAAGQPRGTCSGVTPCLLYISLAALCFYKESKTSLHRLSQFCKWHLCIKSIFT